MVRHFFYVVFGGLAAIVGGIILAGGSLRIYHSIADSFNLKSLSSAASVLLSHGDGTSISAMKRTVLYSASQEEDLINAASVDQTARSVKEITAVSYLVKNLTDGTIIDEKNSNKLVPVASLTKLVTAVVASRLIDGDKLIVIDGNVIKTYGNTAGFKSGETFRASELYFPLLMVSSNDAAEALARSYGRPKFIQAMNNFVQSIGAYRTTFADPSGLSPDNRSTAVDLAIILEWIEENQLAIIRTTIIKTKTIRVHTWINPTHFLSWSNYLGGKNGYTEEADRTAVALFEMGKYKKVYEVIVLGSKVRDADMVKLLAKIRE